MPLSETESAGLIPSLLVLGEKIVSVCKADSDGGKKVTKAELKAIGKELLSLGAKILVDVVD